MSLLRGRAARLLLLGGVALLGGTHAAAGQAIDSIVIMPTSPDEWRASYYLAVPARGIEFARPGGFFRERVWSVRTAGFHLRRAGDAQVAVADSGIAPVRRIDFTFPTYTAPLTKEYELFVGFTDGGAALYTGHFYARPVGDSTAAFTTRVIVMPPAGAHAVVQGRIERGRATFADSTGEGTYIYLGRATPIETPAVLAIVDPGMPGWLASMASRHLPALFAEYAREFDVRLPWKPTVLYSFQDTSVSGLNSGGGTLQGLVAMSLVGSAWKDSTPAALEQAFSLVAHESFHFWNGQVVASDPSPAGAWIHEGSADAMAQLMALKVGIVDSARARAIQEATLNRCAAAVARGPVTTALARGTVREVYDCGFVMALWTGLALQRAKTGGSLAAFWRALLHSALGHGGGYDEARYFQVAREAGVDSTTVAAMQRFLGDSTGMSLAAEGLRRAGARLQEMTSPPAGVDQGVYVRDAMLRLMQGACHRVSFSTGVPIRTDAIAGCPAFATPLAITTIEGQPVATAGAAIYDAVRNRCALGEKVTLGTGSGATVAVPCTQSLAARPPYYRLDRLIVP